MSNNIPAGYELKYNDRGRQFQPEALDMGQIRNQARMQFGAQMIDHHPIFGSSGDVIGYRVQVRAEVLRSFDGRTMNEIFIIHSRTNIRGVEPLDYSNPDYQYMSFSVRLNYDEQLVRAASAQNIPVIIRVREHVNTAYIEHLRRIYERELERRMRDMGATAMMPPNPPNWGEAFSTSGSNIQTMPRRESKEKNLIEGKDVIRLDGSDVGLTENLVLQ